MKKRKRSQADKDAAQVIDKQAMRARQYAAFVRNASAELVYQGPWHSEDLVGVTVPPPDEETRHVFCVIDDPYPAHFAREAMREALARAPTLVHMPVPELRDAEPPATHDDISAALRRAMLGSDQP